MLSESIISLKPSNLLLLYAKNLKLMAIKISRTKKIDEKHCTIYLLNSTKKLKELPFSEAQIKFIKATLQNDKPIATLFTETQHAEIAFLRTSDNENNNLEKARILGSKLCNKLNKAKVDIVNFTNTEADKKYSFPFIEGFALTNYQFLKYKSDKKVNSIKQLKADENSITTGNLTELNNIIESVYTARNLVNEPLSFLTAVELSNQFKVMAKKAGLKVEVFNKKKIESLKMGGLLAVNRGSVTPPTFTILEWKPKNATNKKPIVLVGKGVVYDTGGLSLKPTAGGMDHMKCDMGGAAAVGAAMYAVAKNKLPIHAIALIPATDNRPGVNAYAPGDVIKMHSGATVEVLNTDAEGRMILADALSYAKKYDPMLVIDVATLTGAALRVIGQHGVICMGNADEANKQLMKNCSFEVHERLVELPFWEDYDKMIESDIADIKNTGGKFAGAITAGKFLAHFTNYSWMHFDIAPTAWYYTEQHYRPKNGTGIGVRLLYSIIKKIATNAEQKN